MWRYPSTSGACFSSEQGGYQQLFDEMEVLVTHYGFSLVEARRFSVRERRNWVIRAFERSMTKKEKVDG